MIPTFALPGDRMPGQFGPMRRRPGCAARCVETRSSSWAGMPSVIAMIELDAGVGRLEDRVGGEARRDEDHRRVRAGLARRRRRRC